MASYNSVLTYFRAPRSVEQITKSAQEYEYDAAVPLRYWLRTAAALLKEAEIYSREGDEETTYFLLFRHAHLILAQLAQHPQARDKFLRAQLKEAEGQVSQNLRILDILKPRINGRHERYLRLLHEREARKDAQARRISLGGDESPEGGAYPPGPKAPPLQAREHQDLAVKIAQKEISRRAASRHAAASVEEGDDLQRRLQEIRARIEPHQRVGPPPSDEKAPPGSVTTPGTSYRYPTVPSYRGQQPIIPTSVSQSKSRQTFDDAAAVSTTSPPPSLPPRLHWTETVPPPRPDKVLEEPPARESTAEVSHTFAPSAYLENGTPLRTVFLPPTLRTTFLRLAHQNTLANLETCGFLAGTLIANAFFVNRLIVPAQTATSDTCEMTNESQLFDYVDSEDLMILGWIHTHPTQTCFMSSRDLHTHAGYQMMLAESVAIVCAPSKGDTTHGGDWGVYRLTDPPGKKVILSCEKPGIFHPHDVDNIYTDALRPGHVVEAKGLEFDVVDLRGT